MLTSLIAFHVLALAGVLVAAKFDYRLVDDAGHPLPADGSWREHRVPSAPEVEVTHI